MPNNKTLIDHIYTTIQESKTYYSDHNHIYLNIKKLTINWKVKEAKTWKKQTTQNIFTFFKSNKRTWQQHKN